MRKVRSIFVVLLGAMLLVSGVAAVGPQSWDDCQYFSQTGHRVCGEFLDFFDARGGLALFGYPLTEAFVDDTHEGLYVQYFQRARMEWHPENPAGHKVQLGLLGDELGYTFPPIGEERIPPPDEPGQRYFPETGHVVSFAFLDYFREHGGLDIFGYPRSEFMYEDGRVVQYFQRARMELDPESADGSQMRLTNLGELYIERFGVPGGFGQRVPPPAAMMPTEAGVPTVDPHLSDDCQYFSETGHRVCGDFLDYFNARGGLEIFGYPLTEPFADERRGGMYVQYFQRARMEWRPDNPHDYVVQLGLLVDELGYYFPPVGEERIPASNGPLHHYFPETGHVVSFAFLDYFREHGGLDIFGYPRSEFIYEGGRVVQYFQRARMEWYPESSMGSQMRLANLGEVHIERFGIPGDFDEPIPPPARYEASVQKLTVSASVRNVIAGQQGTQRVFVYVTSPQQRPVEGVPVTATVRYPSGQRQELVLEPTDENGFTAASFEVPPTSSGKRAVIDVTAANRLWKGSTQTFFLPWW